MAEEGGLLTCRLSLVHEEVSKEGWQMKDGGSSAFHKIPVIVVVSVQFPFFNLERFFLTLASPFCSCCYLFPMIGCPSFGVFSRFTPVNCQHKMKNNHVTLSAFPAFTFPIMLTIKFLKNSDSFCPSGREIPSFYYYASCSKASAISKFLGVSKAGQWTNKKTWRLLLPVVAVARWISFFHVRYPLVRSVAIFLDS